ncbi:MAG TPA: transglycosylase domain-containing protein [Actinocrinis sp.]|nr:transglycosylase domain-containing protein [Actinocrinis sp.]
MGDYHQYGRGDGTDDDSAPDGRPRGYGQPDPYGQADPDADNRGYGQQPGPQTPPQPGSGGGRRGYGSPSNPPNPPSAPPQQPASPYSRNPAGPGAGGAPNPRGYGGSPGYGDTPDYGRPVDSYNPPSRRGPQQPIRGEVVSGGPVNLNQPGGPGGPDGPGGPAGTRRMPAADDTRRLSDDDLLGGGGYSTSLPEPRPSRLEERRAARSRGGSAAASQERSTKYDPSPLDGRSTRNGASRAGTGPGGPKRPVKKTGYHRYFDYPRTGKFGWQQWVPSIKQVSSFMLGGFFLVIGLIAFEYFTVQIPSDPPLAQASTYQFSDASTQFMTTGNTTRIDVPLAKVPQVMQNAIVSAENKTFWTDPGVSYTGIVRSFVNDVEGKPLQGGSTLTQQLVKNLFLTDNQTFSRKLDEIFISLKISHSETKGWVLEHYLNTVDFGRNASGVEAAAKLWLGKDITQVTDPSDAALLAALVNAPSTFSAGFRSTNPDPDAAAALKSRWTYVLGQMVDNSYITKAQAASAVFPTPVALNQNTSVSTQSLQMEDAVNSWLDQWAATNPGQNTPTADEVGSGGYTVVTTFNQQYMTLAANAVQDQLLSKLGTGFYNQNLFPGLAAVDPKTGDLVAFYGGSTEENNATQRQVQPGSTFKAFTLATAYNEGYSENSFMDGTNPWPQKGDPNDATILATGSYATVHNDGYSAPSMSFDTATADSVNTAFVRTEQEVGPSKVLTMVKNMGITTANAQNLDDSSGLTLGIASVSPARMADAYSTFPDNGSEYPLVEVAQITRPDGTIWKPIVKPNQVISPTVAETVTDTLTHVTHDPGATACGSHSTCATTQTGMQNIAGKTGTSTMDFTGIDADAANLTGDMKYLNRNNYTTAAVWFNGFTANLEVAVDVSRWVPDANGKAIEWPVDNVNNSGNAFGAGYPLSIWSEFMKSMKTTPLGGDPAFVKPTPTPGAQVLNSPTATPPPTVTATPPPTPSSTPTVGATPSCGGNGNGPGNFFNGSCPTTSPGGSPTNQPTNQPSKSATAQPSTTPTKRFGGLDESGAGD